MKRILSRLVDIFHNSSIPAKNACGREIADALIRRGQLLEDHGKPKAALAKYKLAAAAEPGYPRAHLNLGNALLAMGRLDDATASYRSAITLEPTYAHAYFNLGNVLRQANRLDDAIIAYRHALEQEPSLPGGEYALGRALMERNRPEEAIEPLERALQRDPDSRNVQWLLARAYNLAAYLICRPDAKNKSDSERERAASLCRKAVELDSGYSEGLYQLGMYLEQGGKLDQAEACYLDALSVNPSYAAACYQLASILLRKGDFPAARTRFEQVVSIKPDMAQAHVKLGDFWARDRYFREAEACYLFALSCEPSLIDADIRLGDLKIEDDKPDEAITHFENVLKKEPQNALAYRKIAQVYLNMGRHDEAIELMRQAEMFEVGTPDVQSCMLFTLTCSPALSTEELVSEHFAFGRFCREHIIPLRLHSNDRDTKRRLRIGYVSGDFVKHVVASFVEPLLESHNRDRVIVFCYHNNLKFDAATERIKRQCDFWRDIALLDDASAARLVQDDQIDILVDLSGHSYQNRLMLFAHKPAPVQATWLGYLGTTGMDAMDYRICDTYTDPPGLTENQHSEELARLPNSQWCYRPPVKLPDLGKPPSIANGFLTLGSFSTVLKLNPLTISLWAQVLHALPDARLLLASVSDSSAADNLMREFRGRGIGVDRLMFRHRQQTEEYFASYRDVDVVLDTFPYNGGTTSLDALLMGVPVVTLAGKRSISRGGVSILSNIGLTDLIADTAEDYVHIVRQLAHNPSRLAELRATLRRRMENSPLMDMEGFARDIEQLYRQMWRRWVESGET